MSDRYKVVRKLATGGMAEVYLARATGPKGFQKLLVLKRILPQLAAHERFVEMFLAEARLAALLNHPNVVQIFDFGESRGSYFLAMEFVDGPNLRTVRKAAAAVALPFPCLLAARIVSLACEGLEYAHTFCDPDTGAPLQLIHRDLSPDNILVSRSGAVKVVDFGIAKAAGVSETTRDGMLKGKVSYMAPEQIRGEVLDARADVFSLGVVLYELLTGGRPFRTEESSDVATVHAVLTQKLIPVAQRRPDVPERLARIAEKALRKDREQRYGSMREMQLELEAFLHDERAKVGTYEIAAFLERLQIPSIQVPVGTPATGEVSLTGEIVVVNPQEEVTGASLPRARRPRRFGRWAATLLGAALAFVAVRVAVLRLWPAREPQPVPVADAPALAPVTPPTSAAPPPAPAPAPSAPEVAAPAPAVASPPAPTPKPREKPVKRERERKSAKSTARYSLEIRVRPFATVYLDGKRLGETPFAPVMAEEGPHTLRLVNEELGKDVSVPFVVKPEANIFRLNLAE